MANIKSAIKRIAVAQAQTERNKAVKSRVKTATRKVLAASRGDDAEATEAAFREAVRTIDRAAGKGVLHRRAADRKKSRLARRLARERAAAGD